MITIGIPVLIVKKLLLSDQLLGITQGIRAVGGILGGLLTVLLEKKMKPQKAYIPLFLCSAGACIMTFIMCVQPLGQLLYGFLFERLPNQSVIIIGASIISLAIAMYSKKILISLGENNNRDY